MNIASKGPEEDLDWTEDWTAFLDGDTISASSWECNPPGLEIHSLSRTDVQTTVWLRGGELGKMYELSNTITTAAGREAERSLFVLVENR